MKHFRSLIPLIVVLFVGIILAQPSPDPDPEPEGIDEAKQALEELSDTGSEVEGSDGEQVLGDVERVDQGAANMEDAAGEVDDTITGVDENLTELDRVEEASADALRSLETIPDAQPVAETLRDVLTVVRETQNLVRETLETTRNAAHRGHTWLKKAKLTGELILLGQLVYEVGHNFKWWKLPEEHTENSGKISTSKGDYKVLAEKLKTFNNEYKILFRAEEKMLGYIKSPMHELSKIMPEVDKAAKDVHQAIAPLKKMMTHMKPLHKALRKTEKILNKKITWELRVKKGPIHYTHKISIISVKQAMRGIEHIEKLMTESLDRPVIEALKIFGMKKAAREIKNLAEHPFKEAMELLKPELEKIHIPVISDIEKEFKKTEHLFNSMVKHLKHVAHTGVPDFDQNKYKDIQSKGIRYFTKQCGF